MVLDIYTVSAIVTIVVGVITIYRFIRTKSQQESKPPEPTEPAPHAPDRNLQHVEARLFYPNNVIRENRDPKKNNPHHKIILLKDLKKAYYVGSYAWNLIIMNKIEWFSENDQDIEEWCNNEGYTLFKEDADEDNLLEPYFFAEIRNKKSTYRRGEPLLFRTIYRGNLTNGFFDNQIEAPLGQVFPDGRPVAWSWAPDTLDNDHPTTRGNLDGLVNTYSSDWSWIIPRNAPVGEYTIYMRVYNHIRVGERPIVAQQEDVFVVRASRDKSTKNEEDLSNVRDSISTELENNRQNLVGLFSSGGRDYLDHMFTLTTWNHYRSKIELHYPTIFSDFLEVYSNLEKLNEVIKMSLGTVDYSDPRFRPHKQLALKTEEKIRAILENLND